MGHIKAEVPERYCGVDIHSRGAVFFSFTVLYLLSGTAFLICR